MKLSNKYYSNYWIISLDWLIFFFTASYIRYFTTVFYSHFFFAIKSPCVFLGNLYVKSQKVGLLRTGDIEMVWTVKVNARIYTGGIKFHDDVTQVLPLNDSGASHWTGKRVAKLLSSKHWLCTSVISILKMHSTLLLKERPMRMLWRARLAALKLLAFKDAWTT